MKLDFNMESDDFKQLEANIIAKYAGISQKANPKKAASIEKQIQDFASKFSSAYKKFKQLFLIAHYQRGIYLAFANVKPDNLTYQAAEEDLKKSHKELFELDQALWIHLTLSIFDALLVNLRKLIKDTSSGSGAGKAISMKSILTQICNLHTSIKADSEEFTLFLERLESHIEKAESSQMQGLWDYAYSNVAHLDDKYEYGDSNSFIISDLRTLIDTVNDFMDAICEFYNYGESGHLMNMSYGDAVRWICALGSFMENSLRNVKDDTNAIAFAYYQHPDYINLSPREASSEILKRVVNNPDEFLSLRMSIELELTQRIAELRNKQLFSEIIIEVVEKKYQTYEREHWESGCERVPLANIHFGIVSTGIGDFNGSTGIPELQEIAKIQGKPGEEWQETAQCMLRLFCTIGEIEKYAENVYKLSTNGALYKHLTQKLGILWTDEEGKSLWTM